MEWFFSAYSLILGLVIGSFLGALIYRIPRKLPIAKGFSFCPDCRHRLGVADLVPVLSWLLLRGKCRYCGGRISPRYPAVELLTGILFLLAYRVYGPTWMTLVAMAAFACLILVAMIDFEHGIIPDRLNITLLICGILAAFLFREIGWLERIIGFFAVSVPVLILALTLGGMGEGDVKLFAAMGFLLGWKLILLTLLIAAVTAAVYGLVVAARQESGGKTRIPFGPFIALGGAVSLLWGRELIALYLSLLP